MLRLARKLPFFRILAIARLALVARRHLQALTPHERRRMAQLARHGRSLTPAERRELRELVGRMEPAAFAAATVAAFSPVRIPGLGRRRAR
jgi:hypothetical protein